MKVRVKSVEVNQKAVRKFQLAQEKAAELTAHAILTDIVARKVVPRDRGDLEDDAFVKKHKNFVYHIVYDKPYARRWYFNLEGATFQTTKNKAAQDHWMDYYLDGEGKQWVMDKYLEFLKQESGGVVK